MDQFDFNTIKPKDIEDEISGWLLYLNEFLSVLAFSFALSSLGTNNPVLYSFISLIFLAVLNQNMAKQRSSRFAYLIDKKDKSDHELFILKEYRSKIRYKGLVPLIIGYSLLFSVAVLKSFADEYPKIVSMVYGCIA